MTEQRDHGPLVRVVVDDSGASLARVLLAAREAGRRKLPLELIQPSTSGPSTRQQRAHQMERLDTALNLARRAAPRIDVRIRYESPTSADR